MPLSSRWVHRAPHSLHRLVGRSALIISHLCFPSLCPHSISIVCLGLKSEALFFIQCSPQDSNLDTIAMPIGLFPICDQLQATYYRKRAFAWVVLCTKPSGIHRDNHCGVSNQRSFLAWGQCRFVCNRLATTAFWDFYSLLVEE